MAQERDRDIDYNSIDCSVLCANDLSVVKEAIVEVSANYYHLGVQLDVPPYELDKLPRYDVDKAFSDMVHLWLKGTSTKRGTERTPPSWRSLVRAVASRAGGNNYALAKRIASEHRAQGGDVDAGTAAALVSHNQGSKQNAPSEIYKPLSQPELTATKTADSQCTGTRCCLIAAALVVVILAVCGSGIFHCDGDETVDPLSTTYGNDFDDRSLPHNNVKPTMPQTNSLDRDRGKDPAPNTHSSSYSAGDKTVALFPGTCASINYSNTCCPPNGNCQASDGNCHCSADCHSFGDCCADVHCPTEPRTCMDVGITTCCHDETGSGHCDVHSDDSRCSCNVSCHLRGDCCPDATNIGCIPRTCTDAGKDPGCCIMSKYNSCTVQANGEVCYCDSTCASFDDCCDDVTSSATNQCDLKSNTGDRGKDPAPNTHSSSYSSKRNDFPHMNERPTMPELSNLKRSGGQSPVKIMERIGGEKSSALGDILLNDEHGVRMKNIKHKEQDVEAINREMFYRWLQGGGAKVSWKVLVDALDTVGLNTLANDIIDALSNAKG